LKNKNSSSQNLFPNKFKIKAVRKVNPRARRRNLIRKKAINQIKKTK